MNSQDHYRDYPCDKAIEHQDYVLGLTEDRFGEPSLAEIRATAERRANAKYTYELERIDGVLTLVKKEKEVQG